MSKKYVADIEDVYKAASRIRGIAKRTPILSNNYINEKCFYKNNIKGKVYFKVEAFQQTGSFKFRGALNATRSIMEEMDKKEEDTNRTLDLEDNKKEEDDKNEKIIQVITHSSGNHAAALAYAAKCASNMNSNNKKIVVEATIVMPKGAPPVKKENTIKAGGKIIFVENTNEAREEMAEKIQKETGARFVHPSEDPLVISGQGTVSLEMIQQIRDEDGEELDAVIMPVGGGGLASGNTITLRALLKDKVKIILAEPLEVDDAKRSKTAGKLLPHHSDNKLNTIADGLKTTLGPNTWPVICDLVDDVITVTEEDILKATKFIWETLKVCIEPSSAVSVAVLLGEEFQSKYLNEDDNSHVRNIGVILCGGNVDIVKITDMMKSI